MEKEYFLHRVRGDLKAASRPGVKYIKMYLSTSTSTLKFLKYKYKYKYMNLANVLKYIQVLYSQVQVQVQSTF